MIPPVSKRQGFTLAELLIALAILGVIATFTIPKVLQSQQSSQYNSAAKEAAGMISGAYQAYTQANGANPGMAVTQLTNYMNYVRVDTSSSIDWLQTLTNAQCALATPCYVLHNGGVLYMSSAVTFGTSDSTSAVWVIFDPVMGYSATTTTNKSVAFELYYNGRLRTYGTMANPTCNPVDGCNAPNPAYDPTWFSWN